MKKIISCIVFISILIFTFVKVNQMSLYKYTNRYYMQQKELEALDQDFPVQIYGSCHAYDTFNPIQFKTEYGLDSYNLANPGEIMPLTYLNMKEYIKNNKPEVILIDVWGALADDTYLSQNQIFNEYFPSAIEILPYSKDKQEVIDDYEQVDPLDENLHIAKYKSRFLNFDIQKYDYFFNYYENIEQELYDATLRDENEPLPPGDDTWIFEEMYNRFSHNGFEANEPTDLSDYPYRQTSVSQNEKLPLNDKLQKYLDKIIELCEEENIELVVFRAPYISNDRELKKVNYLKDYLKEKNIPFYDIENEIIWDYSVDFYDSEHLSIYGAEKATSYLGEIINNLINK